MNEMSDEEWRKSRVEALVAEFGSRSALHSAFVGEEGRDGSMVGHWVSGRRPINEKTISKLESLRGGKYKGWFTRPAAKPVERVITSDTEWAVIEDLRSLPPEVQSAVVSQLHDMAEDYRAKTSEVLARLGRPQLSAIEGGGLTTINDNNPLPTGRARDSRKAAHK